MIILITHVYSQGGTERVIEYGTLLNSTEQVLESRELSEAEADSASALWQSKGDLHREYFFPRADADVPYRLYVPLAGMEFQTFPWLCFCTAQAQMKAPASTKITDC